MVMVVTAMGVCGVCNMQELVLGGLLSDILEIEVRHKGNSKQLSVSHFLGKISYPLSSLLMQSPQ